MKFLIRLQDKSSTYAGPMDVVRRIVRSEGLLGLYSGMEATFWRYVRNNKNLASRSIYKFNIPIPPPRSFYPDTSGGTGVTLGA